MSRPLIPNSGFNLLGMTAEELARKLGVSPWTVYEWRKRRIIPYYQVGGKIRFDFGKVKEALLSTEIPAKTPGAGEPSL